MNDYIKRSDLAAIISDLLVSPWTARRMSDVALGIREALCLVQDIVNDEVQNDVLKLPAADVVKVVRCKDCKWYEKIIYTCLQNNGTVPEEGFCSFGEHKEGQR